MTTPDLTANNINAALDSLPQKRLSFATAEQWHDYALQMSLRQPQSDSAPVQKVKGRS